MSSLQPIILWAALPLAILLIVPMLIAVIIEALITVIRTSERQINTNG